MPGYNSVGTISIHVMPEFKNFTRSLRERLVREENYYRRNPLEIAARVEHVDVERSAVVEAQKRIGQQLRDVRAELASIETDRAAGQARKRIQSSLDRMKIRLRNISADHQALKHAGESIAQLGKRRISLENIEVDELELEKEVHRIEHKLSQADATVTVNADADTAMARLKLLWLTRPRVVHVGTVFEDTGKIAQTLAAISGVRSLDKTVNVLRTLAMNLDIVSVKAVAAYGGLGALTGLLLGGTAGVVNFGAGLAKASKAAIGLPAVLTSAALGVGTLIAAVKDAPKVLEDVGRQFKHLQDQISTRFWVQAQDSIRRLVDDSMPELERGFGRVATELGRVTAALVQVVHDSYTSGKMRVMFDATADAIARSKEGLRGFTDGLIQMGTTGAPYVVQLADWFTTLGKRFNTFMRNAAANGDLTRWLNQGVQGLKDMGNVVKNIATAFAGLYKATSNAGVGMAGLVTQTKQFSDMVNKPSFHSRLSTMLEGARKGADGLKKGLVDIGSALGAMAPQVSSWLETAGRQMGKLGSALAQMLRDPSIQSGLAGLQAGFVSFTNSIASLMTGTTSAFGALLNAVGRVSSSVGGVLSGALIAVTPALTTILQAVAALPAPLLAASAGFLALNKALKLDAFAGLGAIVKQFGADVKAAMSTASQAWQAGLTPLTTMQVGLAGLGNAARTAGLALKAAFISNAPMLAVTALATAIGFFAQKSAESRQRSDEFAQSLDKVTGAATKATESTVAQRLEEQGLITAYQQLGGNVSDLTQAIIGKADAQERVNKVFQDWAWVAKHMDSIDAEVAEGATDVKEKFDAFSQTAEAAGLSVFDMTTQAVVAKGKIDDLSKEMADGVAKTKRLSAATSDANTEYERAQQAMDAARDALDKYMNQQRAAVDAQFAARQSTRDYADALDQFNTTMTDTGATARQQEEALDDLAQAGYRMVEANRNNGASHDELRASMDSVRQSVVNAATQFGYSTQQAEAYADSLGLIPDSAITTAKLDTEEALKELDGFVLSVDSSQGTVTINGQSIPANLTLGELIGNINTSDGTVTMNGDKYPASMTLNKLVASVNSSKGTITINGRDYPAQGVMNAIVQKIQTRDPAIKIYAQDNTGGVYQSLISKFTRNFTIGIGAMALNKDGGIMGYQSGVGMIRRFANGGENHVAQIAPAGAWRLWAEPETGGEAYIPLSSSKRKRSVNILRSVADKFGYGLHEYADGAGTESIGATGGNVYNISMNVSARDLRDLQDLAQFVDMVGVRARQGITR